jgi:hypothetical protein
MNLHKKLINNRKKKTSMSYILKGTTIRILLFEIDSSEK